MKRAESEILAIELVFRENYGREMNDQERKYFNVPPTLHSKTVNERLEKIRSYLQERNKRGA